MKDALLKSKAQPRTKYFRVTSLLNYLRHNGRSYDGVKVRLGAGIDRAKGKPRPDCQGIKQGS